jgi:hypothetical protein
MRLWLAFLTVATVAPTLAACSFTGNGDGGGSGSGTDASTVPPDAQQCFGSIVKVCFTKAGDIPNAAAALPTDTIFALNTDSDPLCNTANDQSSNYCVIAGTTLMLASTQTLRAVGSKPLVLLAMGTMDIEGTVDVSSNRNPDLVTSKGAGANPSACVAGMDAQGAGGGYGGSFGGKGGAGETLTGGSNPGAGAGGIAADPITTFPTTLRGGCAGSSGGGTLSGKAGSGGGAVALIASQLSVNGKINASGSGGHGGSAVQVGGGGGGSGGMIILDVTAANIGGTGMVFANGGGGGQGGAPGAGHEGDDGIESSAPATAALGGANTNKDGGSGGNGSAGTLLIGKIGNSSQNLGGGGGGGGASGLVHAPTLNTANVAPPSKDPT